MIHSTTYLLQLLRRQYVVKKQLFAHMKATAGETKKKGIASANDLLNDAARVRDLTAETSLAASQFQRKSGMIASDVSNEDLQRSAFAQSFLAQANYVTKAGFNLQQYKQLESAVSVLETQHGGATMTKNGNVSGNRKAKQRSMNTGPKGLNLTDEIVAHDSRHGHGSVAAFASGGGGGGGNDVTMSSSRKLPHINGTSGGGNVMLSRHPPLDLFKPFAAQQKTKSGADKIWDRTKVANARELHLDVDKNDLTSPMTKSKRIAKKTATKMKQDNGDHLDSVYCMLATDGIPLSQATAYEGGDVKNKHGGTFCSQLALRQYEFKRIRFRLNRRVGSDIGESQISWGMPTKGGGGRQYISPTCLSNVLLAFFIII